MFGKEDPPKASVSPVQEVQPDNPEYVAEPKDNFRVPRSFGNAAERARRNLNAKLANPLAGYTQDELRHQGINFAITHQIGDEEDIRAFAMGAMLAQVPEKFAEVPGLTPEELEVLRNEYTNRWSQPWTMYLVIVLCSLSAAVQGMDETVVNGAQVYYKHQFGIDRGSASRANWLLGLVNSAPYMCCAVMGCWLTVPFNSWFGRRGTIFITCCFSAITCIWQGFVNTWWHMFIARFALGYGIGPKSATVPIYAAETAPPVIRGALVMQWQMWTAFGIMVGYVADLAFFQVEDPSGIVGLNWRLMMASAMVPALIVCCFVFTCPESPRWYMSRNCYDQAYQSMCSLRFIKVQAARDMYYMHTLLQAETDMKLGQNKLVELIAVPRNRRALIASELVMFMQQFCGVNVIAYYSSEIFLGTVASNTQLTVSTQRKALAASFGWGMINWLLAIPAVYTIDTFGRRNLLLTTFPLMALSMFFTGFSFWIPEDTHGSARLGCIALGTYLFGVVYSVGEGPVPFTYSAEAYPLYVRSHGMALATATTWLFNFLLAITWPSLRAAFTPQGAFSWYAAWCIIGWWLILMFMPETKGKTLEELDQVFSVPTRFHAAYGLRQIPYFIRRYILRQKVKPEILYEREDTVPPTEAGFNLP
ncbi:MFS sugar transporter [Aspergillus ellipticus CBS 707.79]|uniref:MFS sugar transporter n=1 Tax=Aspergillus ellipticus CBS 707.79 TaxID=1448320 RepID=A0A319CTK8_9EURO|nr:MFS sugar transporter [Aspergillus ellipticus CBS 707.79]